MWSKAGPGHGKTKRAAIIDDLIEQMDERGLIEDPVCVLLRRCDRLNDMDDHVYAVHMAPETP